MTESRTWYARPVAHEIPKQDVPLCPLCDSPRKRFLHKVWEHEYDNTTDDRFNMVECLECGASYLDPRPADSELGTIYPPNYYSNVLEGQSNADLAEAKKGVFHRLSLWMFKRRINPVSRHVRWAPETKWLDIGCGFGMALESMYQIHGARGVGVDMSERAVSICRQRGFEAHAVKIEDFTAPPGMRFHFIHSSHLIEHVASPLSYLRKVYDLLEPGGVTVFITPNTTTWEARVFGRHWGGLHVPRHWVLFNAASAARAARRVGFEHVETLFSTNSQFWIWSFHSLLSGLLPRNLCDALFPSDHRFVKSGIWTVLRGGFFTAVDTLNVLLTGRSSNMAVILRKPGKA
jgi:2-polyprenyl-3-methyl-5-hydroxy-6-metoxy-1,4-benzoquinol methylase